MWHAMWQKLHSQQLPRGQNHANSAMFNIKENKIKNYKMKIYIYCGCHAITTIIIRNY